MVYTPVLTCIFGRGGAAYLTLAPGPKSTGLYKIVCWIRFFPPARWVVVSLSRL